MQPSYDLRLESLILVILIGKWVHRLELNKFIYPLNKWSNPLTLCSGWLSYSQQCNILSALPRTRHQTCWGILKFDPNAFFLMSCPFPWDFVVPPLEAKYFSSPWLWVQPFEVLWPTCFSRCDITKGTKSSW